MANISPIYLQFFLFFYLFYFWKKSYVEKVN